MIEKQCENCVYYDENHSLKCELKTAKTEAYKEFADRLKEKEKIVKNPFDCTMELAVYVEDIDKTFKELTERKEDK